MAMYGEVTSKKVKYNRLVEFVERNEIFNLLIFQVIHREQGWPRGESACFPPVWPGFDSGPVS